jgi:hypothetical protein
MVVLILLALEAFDQCSECCCAYFGTSVWILFHVELGVNV